jgi:hypothetical protein
MTAADRDLVGGVSTAMRLHLTTSKSIVYPLSGLVWSALTHALTSKIRWGYRLLDASGNGE